jgi:hypothetical protein
LTQPTKWKHNYDRSGLCEMAQTNFKETDSIFTTSVQCETAQTKNATDLINIFDIYLEKQLQTVCLSKKSFDINFFC